MPSGIYKRIVGVNCGFNKGIKFNEKQKRKISKKFKKLGIIPPSRKGCKMSNISKGKMSEKKKGKIPKNIVAGWNKGKKISKEMIKNGYGNWKGGITPKNKIIRNSIEFSLWREAVFARDNWTCQKTGIKGGRLHSHHIKNFAQYPELRFAIDNGITLSKEAHKEFHKIYGRKNNTKEQLEKFLRGKMEGGNFRI